MIMINFVEETKPLLKDIKENAIITTQKLLHVKKQIDLYLDDKSLEEQIYKQGSEFIKKINDTLHLLNCLQLELQYNIKGEVFKTDPVELLPAKELAKIKIKTKNFIENSKALINSLINELVDNSKIILQKLNDLEARIKLNRDTNKVPDDKIYRYQCTKFMNIIFEIRSPTSNLNWLIFKQSNGYDISEEDLQNQEKLINKFYKDNNIVNNLSSEEVANKIMNTYNKNFDIGLFEETKDLIKDLKVNAIFIMQRMIKLVNQINLDMNGKSSEEKELYEEGPLYVKELNDLLNFMNFLIHTLKQNVKGECFKVIVERDTEEIKKIYEENKIFCLSNMSLSEEELKDILEEAKNYKHEDEEDEEDEDDEEDEEEEEEENLYAYEFNEIQQELIKFMGEKKDLNIERLKQFSFVIKDLYNRITDEDVAPTQPKSLIDAISKINKVLEALASMFDDKE